MDGFIEEKRIRYQRTEGVIDCYINKNIKYNSTIIVLVTPKDYDFVHKGDMLLRMGTNYKSIIYAEDDGFFVNHSEKFPKELNNGYHLFTIYKTQDVLQQCVFSSILKKGEDEFTKEPTISATLYGGNKYGFSFGMISIRIQYMDNRHRLNVDFNTHSLKFSKWHSLHFLLADGKVLTFSNFTKSINFSSNRDRPYLNRTTSAIMTDQDIKSLANQKVVKWKLINEEGSVLAEQTVPSYTDMSDNLKDIHRVVFQDFIAKYLSIYNEIKNDLEEIPKECIGNQETDESKPISSSTCYVYLMVDTTNNFHKIGISNNPRYREHTLQSDKPTIELLCAKEYPSRAIAEAFESALHRVYAGKRIRGEWFNLDTSDIEDIKQSLK